jgi:NTE family protein
MDTPGKQTPARRFALVLGGGALRGLAHVGALRALEERDWVPTEVIGTSIGALIAAAWASGLSAGELESIARSLVRTDIFRVAHADMALRRLRARSIYQAEPLDELIRGLLGDASFRDLPRRLIVASVEINSGQQAYWGLPGLDDVRVADAVYASCALPGFFPPRELRGGWWVDGGLSDNLPARLAAARGHEVVLAVDVGARDVVRSDVQEAGFAAVFARASEVLSRHANEALLASWTGPPLLLVRPRVEEVPMLSFRHTGELIDAGHTATREALDVVGEEMGTATGGIFPRRLIEVRVRRERCVGCGACVSLAPPGMFHMDAAGKAVAREEPLEWSPLDGGFVRQCPTFAITARALPRAQAGASTGGGSRGTAPASA